MRVSSLLVSFHMYERGVCSAVSYGTRGFPQLPFRIDLRKKAGWRMVNESTASAIILAKLVLHIEIAG